jgi:tetratricopeptide (TPR) repeat protein
MRLLIITLIVIVVILLLRPLFWGKPPSPDALGLPSELGVADGSSTGADNSKYAAEYRDAILAFQSGDTDKAERIYREIIRSDSKADLAYHGLGSVLAHKGEYAQAEQAFQTAVSIAPHSQLPYYGLGALAMTTKDYDEAIAIYNKMLDMDPGAGPAYWGLGLAYFHKGDCRSATTYLSNVTENAQGTVLAEKAREYISRCK